jgi:hypothetical protein
LFNASPMSNCHFMAARLCLGPSTVLAFSGTISWNLHRANVATDDSFLLHHPDERQR